MGRLFDANVVKEGICAIYPSDNIFGFTTIIYHQILEFPEFRPKRLRDPVTPTIEINGYGRLFDADVVPIT